jgi:hypothetical protein
MIITPEDSRWLNTLANSYRTEVAQTPVSLQESQAKNLYNIIEGIQTALQVDLSEAQVEALIEAFRSTVDSETGAHTPGLARKAWQQFGGAWASAKDAKKQSKIHGEIDRHNDDIDRQNTEIEGKNKEEQADHDSSNQRALARHADRQPRDTSREISVKDGGPDSDGYQWKKDERIDPDGSYEKIRDHKKEGEELKAHQAHWTARLTPKITGKREKRN